MKKHRLLVFENMSRRIRWKLFALWFILLLLAVYDWLMASMSSIGNSLALGESAVYTLPPILGDYWLYIWIAIPALILFWIYYTFVVTRAALIITPQYLILQIPHRKVKISYGRIDTIISTQMAEHYSYKELTGSERRILKKTFRQTCSFLELSSFPKALEQQRRRLPRILFSNRRKGLLLVVDNWLQLNRDLESARTQWLQAKQKLEPQEDDRSLAARILNL